MTLLHQLAIEGVTETPPWQSFVNAVRRQYSCTLASLVLRHTSDPAWNGFATSDADWSVAEWTRKFGARFLAENPFRVEQLAPGEVHPGEKITSRSQLVRTKFYQEILVPYGIERFVCVCLGEPNGYRGWLYLSRPDSKGRFKPNEIEDCRGWLPTMQSALHCFSNLMTKTLETDVYQDVLARNGIGTILLDSQLRVLNIDQAAERIVMRGSALSLVGDELVIHHSALAEQFSSLCHRLLNATASDQARALRIPRIGKCDLYLLLRAMQPSRDYGRRTRDCCLMVFISDPETMHSNAPKQLLSDLFGLTPAEALVASMLAKGLTIQEVAANYELSKGTVRSHVKRIFSKVEVHRQSDLVRLISTLPVLH